MEKVTNIDLEAKVGELLCQLGVPTHIEGYQYLRAAILLTIQDSDNISFMTEKLYPFVAKKYNVSANGVKSAVRHAIEVAWNHGDAEMLNDYFGYSIQNNLKMPSNSEFIAMIADNLRLKYKLY